LSPVMQVINANSPSFADYYFPSITEHDKTLQMIVDLVPQDASILTQNNIFPHFSNRVNAFAYPVEVILDRAPPNDMDAYLNEIVQKSDFILVDMNTDPSTSAAIVSKADAIGVYGTYAIADGICLLKKNFQGDAVFQVP
jgi:uncharacterized membrane protein